MLILVLFNYFIVFKSLKGRRQATKCLTSSRRQKRLVAFFFLSNFGLFLEYELGSDLFRDLHYRIQYFRTWIHNPGWSSIEERYS